jgi:hypothetical protein
MNKIITTITYTIVSVILVSCNNAQKIDETVSEAAISSDETNKTFILTESGVDILQFEKPFERHPNNAAVYDSFEYNSEREYYTLFKKGVEIGYAVGSDNLYCLMIKTPNVVTCNGIHIGMTVRECLSKDSVLAETSVNDFFDDLPTLFISYKNMFFVNSKGFSQSGLEKWNQMIETAKRQIRESGQGENYFYEGASAILSATDFQADDTIEFIEAYWGTEPFYVYGQACEYNNTDPDVLKKEKAKCWY